MTQARKSDELNRSTAFDNKLRPTDFNDSLAVLLADPHVCDDAEESRWAYTCDELDKRIAEILSMRPLPRNVVVFGDLVLDTGKSLDNSGADAYTGRMK